MSGMELEECEANFFGRDCNTQNNKNVEAFFSCRYNLQSEILFFCEKMS